jgi:hypothetical protein
VLFIAPLLISIASSSHPLLIFVCYLITKTNQAKKILQFLVLQVSSIKFENYLKEWYLFTPIKQAAYFKSLLGFGFSLDFKATDYHLTQIKVLMKVYFAN